MGLLQPPGPWSAPRPTLSNEPQELKVLVEREEVPARKEPELRTLERPEHPELPQEVEVPELVLLAERKPLEDREKLSLELLPRDVAAPVP